ncbi:hypothetical protein [Streptomyces neyagawaensis]|nr:hypothetical protein [Streptomyces neyagawaensis]MDE1685761.1 hypothetical protein [Streptomyces neyagawaensis]
MSSNTLAHVGMKRLVLDRIPLFVIDGRQPGPRLSAPTPRDTR